METKEIFMLIGLLINFTVMIGGAVFVVASVKATTAVLVSQVKSLHYALNKLNETHERLDNKIDAHAERLARLESTSHHSTHQVSDS